MDFLPVALKKRKNMKYLISVVIAIGLTTALFAKPSENTMWQQFQAQKAFDSLDDEFEEKKPEPQVVVKEKVIIKEVPVEKVVIKEVVKEVPVVTTAPIMSEPETFSTTTPTTNNGVVKNKAFFDIHTKTQAPILDYIEFKGSRRSFDVNHFANSVSKIKERYINAHIHGFISVPDSISGDQVYVNSGNQYAYDSYGWKKHIYYNNSKTAQNADDFLVDVKTDMFNQRYIDYKIVIYLSEPWRIKPAESNVAPNTFFFKIAPKTRGYQNKYVNADIYVIEE